ncbi:hypothetical protein NA56DRAFT_713314 [Hyaloscypha hepaticicola]|uniref:Uncharacterized protein n=1 Tax=Hyaloscypha hepaticicola TaxID=2082293 RepID=A0A2J6PE21_9HELO|nr:hypothetical protein NA56DRAFT_713314 [Hyaloscypha hepaticicola]
MLALPIQTILYSQTLDFLLFPGFTGTSTAVQEYVDFNVFAPLVCICGMLMLMGKYAWKRLETYFSCFNCPTTLSI